MAALTLFLFTLFSSLLLTASISDVEDDSTRSNGLDHLTSKIRTLENRIEEKTQEIKDRDVVIAAREKMINENSQNMASLESEIASFRDNRNPDAVEQLGEANVRAGELENQVEKLKKDLAMQIEDKEQLEARAHEVGKKASELNSKADKLEKIVDEQKTKLRKTERALQIAEEEMMKAKFETTSKTKELMKVHGAWFPPWMALRLNYCQSLFERKWKLHAKPALQPWMQRAIEKKAQAIEWVAPHIKKLRTEWLPAVKTKWDDNVDPHVQKLTKKTIDIYQVSKNSVMPYFIRAVDLADPYFQGLRRVSTPYITQVATAARPHVNRLHFAVEPYMKGPVRAYGKFLESATTYHYQVQDKVHEKLKGHGLTKHLATKELVWFAASALLALPVFFLFRICSVVFCGKKAKRQPRRNVSSRHY
ncbi:uncharacterized protein LOC121753605 isoform X1 [Salvia splendens]|uniref:uncharacterized protein LOC121753605 isoform X1 n=1 Tax=Salvia splendens TaxID=180675 RepID=UPI001C275885|nr:uncharacterized protein LOC121753605 isoform X1 [Salvia splendens]XP_042004757.1 uncharacterized protein LOC121753605 isoform X1 [Salvia splendens]